MSVGIMLEFELFRDSLEMGFCFEFVYIILQEKIFFSEIKDADHICRIDCVINMCTSYKVIWNSQYQSGDWFTEVIMHRDFYMLYKEYVS